MAGDPNPAAKSTTPTPTGQPRTRLQLFRKPLTTPWRVGLGIACLVTIIVVYSLISWHRSLENPEDNIAPSWSKLWNKGVVPSLTPVWIARRDLTEAQTKELEEAGQRVIWSELRKKEGDEEFPRKRAERTEIQKQRLLALTEPLSPERFQEEVLRSRSVGGTREFTIELSPTERRWFDEAQAEALSQLSPEDQAKVNEALRKINEAADREEAKRDVYHILLWDDTTSTFFRLALGLATAVLVSLTLGLVMGCYPVADAYCYPPLAVLAKIPGTAVTALFMVLPLVGLNWKFYQAMILFGLIPTLTQTFYVYTKEVPEELIYKARTLGASQMECIFSVIVPNIIPKVVETIRLSVGPALIFLIAAEFLYGDTGTGLGCTLRLVDKKGVGFLPVTYFYLLVIAAFGFAIDWSLRWAQRKLFPWYYPE